MIAVFAVPGAAKNEPVGTWIFPVIAVVTPPTGVKVVPEGTMTVAPAVMVSDWPGDSVVVVEFATTRESDCVAVVTWRHDKLQKLPISPPVPTDGMPCRPG